MASVPTPRSYASILGEMLEVFASRHDINGIKPGSPLLAIFEAAAQSDARNAQDIFATLNALDIDRANGPDLDVLGAGEKVIRQSATNATGVVTVGDNTFIKKYGTVWTGAAAPIPGVTTIYVTVASWPTTGSLYIGRGTTNVEGPITFTAATESTPGVWAVTLSSGVTKSHLPGDEVVLAQGGDRTISAGQVFTNIPLAGTEATNFAVTDAVVLYDGEDTVFNVPVRCQTAGSAGNVGAGAIVSVPNLPFDGCTVTNPVAFSNALDTENDVAYRNRIKVARRSKAKGTIDAIQTAIYGATTPDEPAVVSGSTIVRRLGLPDMLYIDDGTGYEPKDAGIGYESILPAGSPGISRFVLNNGPVAKAAVTTKNAAPYAIPLGGRLTVEVGGVASTHVFDLTQFADTTATAYEIASSINANSALLYSARTAGSGRYVTILPKAETASIQVTGGTANTALGFPLYRAEDIFLYLNDRPLAATLDRNVAQVELGAVTSGAITAGTRYTNGFIASTVPARVVVDGDSSAIFSSIENASIRWTFWGTEPIAKVEVGLGNFTPALTPFIDCRPGDTLIFDLEVAMGPAGSFGYAYSPRVTYVPPDGSFLLVEIPEQTVAGTVTYVTTNTVMSVVRTQGVAQYATVNTTTPTVDALALAGVNLYSRSGEYRAATNSATGDILAVNMGVGPAAPVSATSAQSHLAVVESKPGYTPEFNWWRFVETNPTATTLTAQTLTSTPIENSFGTAFACRVGRPMPVERFNSNIISAKYRQGVASGRILEVIGYTGSNLTYRNEAGNITPYDGSTPAGVYTSAGDGVSQYGAILQSMQGYRFHPLDTLTVSVDGRQPGMAVPMYKQCLATTPYGTTLELNTGGNPLATTFGTEFDFGGFAIHQRPKAVLSVRDNVGVVAANGSAIAYAPIGVGANVAAQITGPYPINTPAATDLVADSTGRLLAKYRLAPGTEIGVSGILSGEYYKAAIVAGPTAQSNKLTWRYAWEVTFAQRTTDVTTITFSAGDFTANNPFTVGESVYVTLNNGSFVDSGTPIVITNTGGASPNWTISYSDPGANTAGAIAVTGWLATLPIAPAATPYGFEDFSVNPATGLDWVLVRFNSVSTPYTPFAMDDVYPMYARTAGSFSLLVPSADYPVAQYDAVSEQTIQSPWSNVFFGYSTTASFADLAAVGGDFGLMPYSGAGYTTQRIPYDTRHEYLLGYRSAPYVTYTEGTNYVGWSEITGSVYSLHLKNPIDPSLSGYYGFTSEPLYLVPVTPKNVSEFLAKTSALNVARTGRHSVSLWSDTLGSYSAIEVSGAATAATKTLTAHPTIRTQFYLQDKDNLLGNTWAKLTAPAVAPKTVFSATGTFSVASGVVTATRDGVVGVSPYAGTMAGPVQGTRWYTEVAGDYTGFFYTDAAIPAAGFGTVQAGDWVTVDSGVGSWRPTGYIAAQPTDGVAVNLPNGAVARFGGISGTTVSDKWYYYDPQAGVWGENTMACGPRQNHTATALPDGKVMIVGGNSDNVGTTVNTIHIVDPDTNTWVNVTDTLKLANGVTANPLRFHTATLMGTDVVVCGGLNSQQWYIISYNATTPAASTVYRSPRTLNVERGNHGAVKVSPTKILLVGGVTGTSFELVDVAGEAAYILGYTDQTYSNIVAIPNTSEVLAFGCDIANSKQAARINWASGVSTPVSPSLDWLNSAQGFEIGGKIYCLGNEPANRTIGNVYDPATDSWTRIEGCIFYGNVRGKRSNVLLNGEIMATAGAPEIYTPGTTAKVQGTWQVAQLQSDVVSDRYAFWVEADLGWLDVPVSYMEFRRYDAAMVGDRIVVASDVLGVANQKEFTITGVSGTNTLTTTPTMSTASATLGVKYTTVQILPASVNSLVRRLQWVATTPDGILGRMVPSTGATYSNENVVGNDWTLTPMGKMVFTAPIAYGVDAYRYNTGLVKEVNRIVYGDPADPALHPGVIAAGSSMNIDGPQVKQVKVSLQIRADQGADVISSVQSAVTKAVNETPIGTNVAISDIVSAANNVPGVLSVAVLYPTYTAGSDLITVQPFEKAMVLATQDVSVVTTGA